MQGLIAVGRLGPDHFLVEVASNDGYLLRHAKERGVPVLGIEPTAGPAAAARALGIPTLQAFFGRGMAADLRREHGPADVIVANNVMAHVPDLNGFVEGFRELIADDGLITIENPTCATCSTMPSSTRSTTSTGATSRARPWMH